MRVPDQIRYSHMVCKACGEKITSFDEEILERSNGGMKKKILALAMVAMFTSIIASGTLAYFTAEEKVHNVITSGGVDIELVEKTKGNDGVEVDFPSDGIHGVIPGTSVSAMPSRAPMSVLTRLMPAPMTMVPMAP